MAQITVGQAVELALQHARNGWTDQAEEIFRKLETVVGNNPIACAGLGAKAQEAGLGETAIRFFRKAAQLQPELSMGWHNLGVTLAKQRRFLEAVDAFERAAVLEPSNAQIFSNLGHAYQDSQQFQPAIDAFEKV